MPALAPVRAERQLVEVGGRAGGAQHAVEHRLRVAGGRFEQVFDPGCETSFFGFSVGCPRLVSALADRSLLAAYAQGLRPVPRALVEAKAKEFDSARTDELWEADVWEC